MNISAEAIVGLNYQERFEQQADPTAVTSFVQDDSGSSITESAARSAAVTISLSPAASVMMAKGEAALALLSGVGTARSASSASPKHDAWTQQSETITPSKGAYQSGGGNEVSDVQSDAGYEAALQQSLSQNSADVVADYVNSFGGPAALMNDLDPAKVSSFVAAFNSGTLKIESADARPDLGISQNTTFSSGSVSETTNQDGNAILAADKANDTYTEVLSFAGIGALVVSWSRNAGTSVQP